ncbi:ATP-binding protein [Candidatus Poriferisodalis sp.]|uniref:ATP-binding protein n=1 Tax=Candidatus Poriferisodalis sp. TaxID=3101277 RepID=UPI003C6EE4F3
MEMVPRDLKPQVDAALDTFRVVVLHGARQCGKTTLAQAVAAERGGTYTTLDDPLVRAAALDDPPTFLHNQPHPLVIDEIQLGGDRLIRAVKMAVDDQGEPGRFLLTGSTNFLTVPTISESLAGRAAILQLWPLSQREIATHVAIADDPVVAGGVGPVAAGVESAISAWFSGDVHLGTSAATARDAYLRLVCRGGYPEPFELTGTSRRRWFDSYVTTVLNRDIVALGDLRAGPALGRLIRLAAASTATEVNLSDWARRIGLDRRTVEGYLGWMRTVFLIHELPAWTRNRARRVIKRPKLNIADTGLAAALLRLDANELRAPNATMTGPLVETFVVNEIAQQISSADEAIDMYHFRDNTGREVDIVLERTDGSIVAVEVKASASPAPSQLRDVAWLRDRSDQTEPGTFTAGVLLHTGTHALKLGDRLYVLPIDRLWTSSGPSVPPKMPTS